MGSPGTQPQTVRTPHGGYSWSTNAVEPNIRRFNSTDAPSLFSHSVNPATPPGSVSGSSAGGGSTAVDCSLDYWLVGNNKIQRREINPIKDRQRERKKERKEKKKRKENIKLEKTAQDTGRSPAPPAGLFSA